jgi:hypothetical protein
MADIEVGNQLRSFFLELLAGTNLIEYYEERDVFIDKRVLDVDNDRRRLGPGEPGVEHPYLGTEAQALVRSDALREIEDSILLVTGSGKATPIWVVSPPMSSDS